MLLEVEMALEVNREEDKTMNTLLRCLEHLGLSLNFEPSLACPACHQYLPNLKNTPDWAGCPLRRVSGGASLIGLRNSNFSTLTPKCKTGGTSWFLLSDLQTNMKCWEKKNKEEGILSRSGRVLTSFSNISILLSHLRPSLFSQAIAPWIGLTWRAHHEIQRKSYSYANLDVKGNVHDPCWRFEGH